MKPKEFLFKGKGVCYRGSDFKNRRKGRGIIYLSNTQLRCIFKNGGEVVIPLNAIKNLNFHKVGALFGEKGVKRISVQTDTDELYTFLTVELNTLYNLLSKVITNIPVEGGVQVGQKPFPWGWLIWLIIVFVGILLIFLWPPFGEILKFFNLI
ncbi:MAG: hypothetical protein ACTSO6_09300 [Promethearchaeota archaeon]